MHKNILLIVVALLTSWAGCVHSATLYKWVDEDGNVTYQDTPPPGDVQFESSDVDGPRPPLPDEAGLKIEEAALANPVSLYTVPQCASCDLVRLYLERNSIPFAEKDVRNNVDTQNELENIAGALTVPTLVIGDQVLDGYSQNAIKAALTNAGFPIDPPPQEGEEQAQEDGEEPDTESEGIDEEALPDTDADGEVES
ncbi:MAG: DUF4124 domain-containing protein [bacterium]